MFKFILYIKHYYNNQTFDKATIKAVKRYHLVINSRLHACVAMYEEAVYGLRTGWWSARPIVKHMQPTVQKNDAELPQLRPPYALPAHIIIKIPIQDWSGFNKNWQQKKVNEIVIRNSKLKRWVNPSHLCQKIWWSKLCV